MTSHYTDYRQKWRQRRQRMRLRRLPLFVAGLALLAAIGVLSARERRPQLGVVAWAYGNGSRGMPRLGMDDGVLVAVWEYGSVTAHSAATGVPLWPAPFDRAHQFDGPPALGGQRIVMGGSDGQVRCLDLHTGELLWGFDAQTIVRSHPLVLADRVCIGGDDGRLYCLKLADGTLLWAYPPVDQADRDPILGGPAAWGHTLVCGSCARDAFGLDLQTGALRWRMALEAPVVARVAVEAGRAYIAAENGTAVCLLAEDGKPIWQKQVAFLVRQPIAVRNQRAFILATDGTVWCVDALTGRDLWRRKLRGRPTTCAATDEERLYVGTSEDLVEALDQQTGNTAWQWRPGSKPLGEVLIDPQRLYCTTADARVFAVRLAQ